MSVAVLLHLAATAACAGGLAATAPASPAPSPTVYLATPSSMEPAAGICSASEGLVVVIALHPDIPDPRCAVVQPEQRLQIRNDNDSVRQVTLGQFQFEVPPGGTYLLDEAFGSYLRPGVHLLQVLPCCGPSLWLKPE